MLKIRFYFDEDSWLGPGKAALLEAIETQGSISAAGRHMGMSYKRAWDLVQELNRIFGTPVVVGQMGGRHGGGAELTDTGRAFVAQFRALEQAAASATKPHRDELEKMRKKARSKR